ncbi:hypothetical protein SISSUDRAFT_984425 [Sistotremastrum suecicum HHB10207 ss-3]|uniref:Protein kinase domain-containing protein n=1 Tax=Sistotremastrum suecicum HHB10207 ss-3 TaxID=1314776 RepID=A0A166EK11_9AGAM|nr:hypothetical protein SISSUDRAFT_984425 [Sistotremastrum suecicum HHB10207 ss-3]
MHNSLTPTAGHWNLFIDDWLHRDVSLGNVMLLEEPEEREPVYDFTDIKILETTQEKCIGMIIDGDHAIIWWRRRGPQAGHRSGTLPYLSLRLCRLWSAGQHTQLPHTALDDLESFIWVLMHVILMKIPSSLVRNQWLEGMAREDLPTLFQAKGHIRAEISYWENGESAPHPALEAFAGVLIALFKIAGRAGAECARLAKDVQGMERDDIVSACKPYYEEYLSTILDALDTLPEEWPTSDAYELPQEYVEEDSPSDSGDEC